jgi:hypothetical protein
MGGDDGVKLGSVFGVLGAADGEELGSLFGVADIVASVVSPSLPPAAAESVVSSSPQPTSTNAAENVNATMAVVPLRIPKFFAIFIPTHL